MLSLSEQGRTMLEGINLSLLRCSYRRFEQSQRPHSARQTPLAKTLYHKDLSVALLCTSLALSLPALQLLLSLLMPFLNLRMDIVTR